MHKIIASAVCALAFTWGDLHAAQDENSVYGHLECFSGGSKVECDSAMLSGADGDICMLLQGMAKLLGTLQTGR